MLHRMRRAVYKATLSPPDGSVVQKKAVVMNDFLAEEVGALSEKELERQAEEGKALERANSLDSLTGRAWA